VQRVVLGLLLVAAVWGLVAAAVPEQASTPDLPASVHLQRWHYGRGFALPEAPEPSGLCYVVERDSLFLVDDGDVDRPAGVYEISLEGQVLQKREVGVDLEGICYCTGDGMLYLADEHKETVWVVQPADLVVRSSFTVALGFPDRIVITPGGNGFEGIEYIPSTSDCERDYFMLLNQDDPPALVRVNRCDIELHGDESVPIADFHRLPDINCGELWYDHASEQLWVVHSWENVYEVLDIDTLAVQSWEICPGSAQEAVTKDGQGRLWIGSDSGGLAYYTDQAQP
jgi:uncharacterized protein YjiK